MIQHLDNLLRELFMTQIIEITDEAQVRFQPPDEDWRTEVTNLQQNALNVYLADVRENRRLRSNERVRSTNSGMVTEEPAPARLDCHYLITAWSPAQPAAAVEPTLDEHRLLYQTTAVLMNNGTLNPSRVYPPGSPALDPDNPNAVPSLIREADLPAQILPVDGFPKLAEFWGTMGANHRWKPAIYLVVTLPVAFEEQEAGPMVTTRIIEYRQTGRPETAKIRIQIGGQVLDATGDGEPVPLANAWVRLESTAGALLQTATTDALGRFIFGGLPPDQYQLNWRADGFPVPAAPRIIDVPSSDGDYDLRFEES